MWLQLADGRNVIIGWSEDESGCNIITRWKECNYRIEVTEMKVAAITGWKECNYRNRDESGCNYRMEGM